MKPKQRKIDEPQPRRRGVVTRRMRLSERCLWLEAPKHDFWGRGVTVMSSYTMASLPWMMMIRSRARATPTEVTHHRPRHLSNARRAHDHHYPQVGVGVVGRPAERVLHGADDGSLRPRRPIWVATTRRSAGPDDARGRKPDDATRQPTGRHAAGHEAAQTGVRRRAPVLRDDTHRLGVRPARIGTTSEGGVELVEIAALGGATQGLAGIEIVHHVLGAARHRALAS